MKSQLITVSMIMLFVLLVGCSNSPSDTKQETSATTTSSTLSTTSREEELQIDGTYYNTVDGGTATIKNIKGNNWEINYATVDGDITATFKTTWQSDGKMKVSETPMIKSDGYAGFNINIQYSDSDEILITMSDGNPEYEMQFSSHKPVIDYDQILTGDLSSFAGLYSNDRMEELIVENDFTMNAYSPEDFYNENTSLFPSLTKNQKSNNKWMFWSGSIHALYALDLEKLPKKIDNYYEVYFVGANAIAIEGQELILYFIPAGMTGPDGITSDERRIFYNLEGSYSIREYHNAWWESYPSQDNNLDIPAINDGDFSSLVGTWRNGQGDTLTINMDGTTNGEGKITPVKDSGENGQVPYVTYSYGYTGAAIALFEIGLRNPEGDQSNITRPRLVITQNARNYSADSYYYRQ